MTSVPTIPLGFGTMGLTTDNDGAGAVKRAIEEGYRHIDTAQKYGNEELVGEGIDAATVDREDLFVATKISESNLAHKDVLRTAHESLDRLGLDTIDLLYVHWPAVTGESDRYDPSATLAAFETLVEDGYVEHVGVANFSPELLAEATQYIDAPIVANQVEMHPLLQQRTLRKYASTTGVQLVAYCPMMRGKIGEVPELIDIAESYDATAGQVSLAWLLSKENVAPIPRSSGSHITENYEATELTLSSEDIERIDRIDRENRVVNPDKGPWNW